jgi:hypothetical protein
LLHGATSAETKTKVEPFSCPLALQTTSDPQRDDPGPDLFLLQPLIRFLGEEEEEELGKGCSDRRLL